jgi:peptidoglycan-associated lipoprotein
VQPAAQPAPQQAQLDIAPDIRRICGITEAQALFAYDSSRVQAGDHPVLDKLAQCFTTGPLAGRKMRLVGHADPRGDEEYNMALGGRRSASVKTYLVGAGLKDEQAETTSRGEMDAVGTDEATWAKDRRVQIVLAD